MKKRFISSVLMALVCAGLISCTTFHAKQPTPVESPGDTVIVMVPDTGCLLELNKTRLKVDSLQAANDSIGRKLLLSNYKVEKVRYYLNITLRDRSQDKFLKGWIRRALE